MGLKKQICDFTALGAYGMNRGMWLAHFVVWVTQLWLNGESYYVAFKSQIQPTVNLQRLPTAMFNSYGMCFPLENNFPRLSPVA